MSPEPTSLEPPQFEPGAGKAAWRAYGGQHHHVLAQFRISEAGAPEAALHMLSYRPAKPTARTTHEVNAYNRTQLGGACHVPVETTEHPA